jgi:hypothetical protein
VSYRIRAVRVFDVEVVVARLDVGGADFPGVLIFDPIIPLDFSR